jgi:hypothetical protein
MLKDGIVLRLTFITLTFMVYVAWNIYAVGQQAGADL